MFWMLQPKIDVHRIRDSRRIIEVNFCATAPYEITSRNRLGNPIFRNIDYESSHESIYLGNDDRSKLNRMCWARRCWRRHRVCRQSRALSACAIYIYHMHPVQFRLLPLRKLHLAKLLDAGNGATLRPRLTDRQSPAKRADSRSRRLNTAADRLP
jgi:hypothetical protein